MLDKPGIRQAADDEGGTGHEHEKDRANGYPRSSPRRLRTVINRTTNCGWASTPIPTPRIMAVTAVYQRS